MPRKILLADDSVTAQNMGRRILSEAGYEVVTVNNGSAALKKLAEDPPDLAILDIYMPGYGGFEVCQRIKENGETSSIPVLLTVGKLEPFKAEEARRVHADAHLVKPFEATELLAALTRLEDKIVPRAIPIPVGKAAKSKASDASANPDKEKKSGSADNSWKQRLTIPPPEAKRQEAEESEAPSAAFREFVHPETQEASEAATPAVFSRDEADRGITADEIAAISAAAAAFGNNANSPEAERSAAPASYAEILAAVSPAPVPLEEAREAIAEPEPYAVPEPVAKTEVEEAPEVIAEPEPEAMPGPVADSLPEASQATDVALASEADVAEELPADATTADPEPAVAQQEYAASDESADAEVAAALESLGTVFGNNGSATEARNGQGFGARVGVGEEAFAEKGSGWRSFADGRARWMAEEVTVPESEASLILEEEMQKVYAALAEFGHGITSSAMEAQSTPGYATMGSEQESSVLEIPVPEIPAADVSTILVEETISSLAIDLTVETVSSDEPEPFSVAGMEPVAEATSFAPMAEMSAPEVAVEAYEQREEVPAPEPSSESAAAVAFVSDSLVTESGEGEQPPEIVGPVATSTGPVEEGSLQEESAYAAAASAGTEFRSIGHVDATPASEASREYSEAQSPAAPAEVDRAHEAELAAAWAHWRQIRESVANPQFTSQLADVAAAGYKEIQAAEAVTPPAESLSSDAESSATDSSAIASIVDSVLAELRPKLVAEIARKLANKK